MYVMEHRGSTPLASTNYFSMKEDFKNAIVFTGHRGSGKISKHFLRQLVKLKIKGTDSIWEKYEDRAIPLLESLINNPKYKKIFVFVLYIEDAAVKNRGYVNLKYAKKIEEFIKQKDVHNKCEVMHPYKKGRLLGNKIETNKFLTRIGVPCPKIITSKDYNGPIFVNAVEGSRSPEAQAKPNALELDGTKYNTELIDTIYEYKGKTYYVNPRVMCMGGEISHFIIKCISTEKNDRVVRTPWDVTYNEAPGLQYDFFKTQIVPEYEYLLNICKTIEKHLGFGAYSYDLLRDVKNKKWFVSEAMIKFDSSGSVRKSPYSIITYRQIQKEVYGKVFPEDKKLARMENVPLHRDLIDEFGILTESEYESIMDATIYWSKLLYKNYFEDRYKKMCV